MHLPGRRNLTQLEAEQRARLLAVDSYEISLDLTGGPDAPTFRCTTEIRFACREPGATTFIEVAAVSITSARLNGTPVELAGWRAEEGLTLPGLAADNVLVVEADMAYSTLGSGMTRVIDPADKGCYLHTQFEPADAQKVFACFDQPDLKAEFTWRATVPEHWVVVSNCPATGSEPAGPGSRRVEFAPTPRMSTYINALCAGDYHQVRETHDGIDLGILCTTALAPHLDAADIFLVTRQAFDYFHAEFDYRYPLTKYDQVFAPGGQGGAMENLGCVIFADQYFIHRSAITATEELRRAVVIAHEMAHMWFGDIVTMRWWDDLWLNESFATWASYAALTAATRFPDAWSQFLEQKETAYRADQLPSTHPVYTDVPDVTTGMSNFDAITYPKGASVLKQLVAYVGPTAFRDGLRAYFRRHEYGNATFADLLAAISATSGRELTAFAREWLETAQVNTLRPELAVGADGRYEQVAVRQSAPASHPTLRHHQLAIGRYALTGGELTRQGQVQLEVSGEHTPVPDLVGQPAPDLLLLNDDDLTYAKVRFDQRSLETVLSHLGAITELLPRRLCHATLWDMTRDGELAARRYVRTVAASLPGETDVHLIAGGFGRLQAALDEYVDPSWAAEGWALLADTARAALAGSEPGSGRQLAWARVYVNAASAPGDLATMRDWLDGTGRPDGLPLGPALRWQVIGALAAHGRMSAEEIDGELARDDTIEGGMLAATALALIPTAESKAAAWAALTTGDGQHILRQRATLQGLHHRTQLDLTEPYRQAFFERLDELWERWDERQAFEFTVLGYPRQHVSAAAVEQGEAWLRADGRSSLLQRLITERVDNTRRALRARTADTA